MSIYITNPPSSTLFHLLRLSRRLYALQIPQHCSDRPHETLLDTARLAIFDRDQILDEGHTNVCTDSGENVPPAMKLEEEPPRQTESVLEARDVRAEMEINVPEEVAEETRSYMRLHSATALNLPASRGRNARGDFNVPDPKFAKVLSRFWDPSF
jgi:hypothetical protein